VKSLILVNRSAGSVENLDGLLKQLGRFRPSDIYVTKRAGEAETKTRKAIRTGYELVVAAGGDGTLNEVINAVAQSKCARQICIGLVPLGTGNDFARMLGLPHKIDENIDILRAGRTALFDLVRVESDRVRYFVNVSAGGFSGAVGQKLTPEIKRTWGPLAYLRSAAAALPKLCAYRATVLFDEHEKESVDLYNVIVANGRFVAGGLPIAPEADPCDGALDVVLIPARQPAELALLAAQILLGNHLNNEAIIFRRAAKVAVKSRPGMSFTVDGEPVGRTPIVFKVVPKAVNFVISDG